jgi:predicted acyltransferase (DUF342 family)
VSLGPDPLDRLAIPDGTTVEEHDLVTDGDVLVGRRGTVEFGVRGRNVLAGEGARFGGDIEAEADCRLDMWADVDGNVLVGRDAYLGERVEVHGQLRVAGDLDIGDDVDIEEGFEANGWIVIRNPMPTVVVLFVYLSQLLRVGEDDAAERLLEGLTEDENDDAEAEADVDPVVVPRGATIGDETWRTSTPATVGDECRLHGNVRATTIKVGENGDVFGSLRAREDITVGSETTVHGDVTTRSGTVELAPDARVLGDISCGRLELASKAAVDGAMRATDEVSMRHDLDREPQ